MRINLAYLSQAAEASSKFITNQPELSKRNKSRHNNHNN